MEKRRYQVISRLPVKILAALLCVLSLISAGVFTCLAVLNDQCDMSSMTEEEYAEKMREKLSENYSAYILDGLTHGFETAPLTDTNFRYAVVKSDGESLADVDLTDHGNYVAGSPQEAEQYTYLFQGVDKAEYWYDISEMAAYDLWDSYSHYYFCEEESRIYADINQFVYAYDQGVFYFRTAQGDYPAQNICIADQTRLELDEYGNYIEDGSFEEIVSIDAGIAYGVNYTRYHLEKGIDGEGNTILLYIADEDGEVLDCSLCESWREVGFYDNEWNWHAGFDVRFVKKEVAQTETAASETVSQTPVEIEGEQSDIAGNVDFYEETEDMEDPEEEEPMEMTQEQILVTAPRDLTLKPVTLAQLKPVDPEGNDYSISGKTSIWVRNPENGRSNYFVLSHVLDPEESGISDVFAQADRNVHLYYLVSSHAIACEVISVLLLIISFLIFCCGVGHRSDTEQIVMTWLDRTPFEIVTAGYLVAAGLAIGACVLAGEEGQGIRLILAVFTQMALAGGMLTMLYLATLLVRIKAHMFWRYTILGGILHWLARKLAGLRALIRENVSVFWQCLIVTAAALLVDFFVVAFGGGDGSAVILFFFRIGSSVLLIWFALQLSRLHKGTKKLTGGSFAQRIDTRTLIGPFRDHAEDLNHIGDGLEEAVREQIKSEHLRTELITNVSHDIKTPLTSIINYVDLLQKLNLEDAQAQEYLEVLSRQSARLKKLIEDLMEASKASTGNLEVHMETTDAAVLLEQAVGEFEEKLAARKLELVVQAPETPVEIMADGRHLWRIFENLLGNICKYAMEGSRVYVTLTDDGQNATIIFRNISAYPLNITPEELMERFVRGDSSRHTEGSGLGLSIAQSLTTLMNGKMLLNIDGDLFKVTLQFKH